MTEMRIVEMTGGALKTLFAFDRAKREAQRRQGLGESGVIEAFFDMADILELAMLGLIDREGELTEDADEVLKLAREMGVTDE